MPIDFLFIFVYYRLINFSPDPINHNKRLTMKKYICFFIGFVIILSIELFYWEDFSGNPKELSQKFSNGAIASSTENGEDATAKTGTGIDPAIIVLLGTGVVGLVGIGRKRASK